MFKDKFFCGDCSVSDLRDAAETVWDSCCLELPAEHVNCSVCERLKHEVLTIRQVKIIKAYVYLVKPSEAEDFISALYCFLRLKKESSPAPSAHSSKEGLNFADSFSVGQHHNISTGSYHGVNFVD